jgi:hypothetical protein
LLLVQMLVELLVELLAMHGLLLHPCPSAHQPACLRTGPPPHSFSGPSLLSSLPTHTAGLLLQRGEVLGGDAQRHQR